jgi:hypothetical protein
MTRHGFTDLARAIADIEDLIHTCLGDGNSEAGMHWQELAADAPNHKTNAALLMEGSKAPDPLTALEGGVRRMRTSLYFLNLATVMPRQVDATRREQRCGST